MRRRLWCRHSPLGKGRLLGLALSTALTVGCGASGSVNVQAGQAAESQTTGVLPVTERRPAPKLVAPLLGGGVLELASLRGSVVVINTWGSWCAPCRAEAPTLEKVYTSTRQAGVFFLGIDVRDNRAAARAFQRTFRVTYPSLFDEDGSVLARFQTLPPSAVPSTLVVDRRGLVASRFIGGVRVDDLLPVVTRIASEAP